MECKHRPELTLKEYMRNVFSKNKKRMNQDCRCRDCGRVLCVENGRRPAFARLIASLPLVLILALGISCLVILAQDVFAAHDSPVIVRLAVCVVLVLVLAFVGKAAGAAADYLAAKHFTKWVAADADQPADDEPDKINEAALAEKEFGLHSMQDVNR